MKTRFTARANVQFLTALAWFEERSSATAREFVEAIENVVGRLEMWPLSAPEVLPGLYRAQIPGSDYAIFYLLSGDFIEVVGLLHGRQSPEEWRRLVD